MQINDCLAQQLKVAVPLGIFGISRRKVLGNRQRFLI